MKQNSFLRIFVIFRVSTSINTP